MVEVECLPALAAGVHVEGRIAVWRIAEGVRDQLREVEVAFARGRRVAS